MIDLLSASVVGIIAGVFLGFKLKNLAISLDADNGVTFIKGVPHVLKHYGPKQNYPSAPGRDYSDYACPVCSAQGTAFMSCDTSRGDCPDGRF